MRAVQRLAFRKVLAMADPYKDRTVIAEAHCDLGALHRDRGELNPAQAKADTCLEIFESLGDKQGIAVASLLSGLIHQTRGDLERAEGAFKKGLAFDQAVGETERWAWIT